MKLKVRPLMLAALAVASVAPLARAADSVTLTPNLVTATKVGGGALPTTPPTKLQGNTLYIYGSAQAAVYTINFSALANLAAGEGFGSVAYNPALSSGLTLVSPTYTPDTSAVWTFTLPGNQNETINNTYNGTNVVASIGPYTSADATRSAFAQSASAKVGALTVQWDGATNNATLKLQDTTGDAVNNQIQFQTDNLANGTLNPAATSAGQFDVQFIKPLAGDANLDGTVNFSDFLVLQNNYNHTGTTWSQGNFNGDNVTNFSDFLILQNSYNHTWTTGLSPAVGSASPAISTPEPASVGLLVAGFAALAVRRKRSI